MFTMNAQGKMEEATPKPRLLIGSIVYHFGYAMSEHKGCVISEPDANGSQKCVTLSDYDNHFFTVDQYSRPLTKKFGIGVYYDDQTNELIEQSVIDEMVVRAIAQDAREKAEKEAEDNAYAEELAGMAAKYPFLKPLKGNGLNGDYKAMKAARKANLVAMLVHTFPGIYFSVKNDHASTYTIRWENGPTVDEVNEVCRMFQSSRFNGMTDSKEYYRNAFAETFGSFDYLFTHRDMSDGLREYMPMGEDHDYNDRYSETNQFKRTFERTSFPAGAKITGYENESFTFTAPEAQPQATHATIGDIEISDYSEKAIVVRGNTKPIKDKLSAMGGRFNFRLQGGAGWIFPKTKRDSVAAALGLS